MSDLPVEVSSEVTFEQLNLNESLLQAIQSSGYTKTTPIQAQAIPPLLEGRDVLGQAQTGTGKTAAFALPMLQRIDVTQDATQILVLTPTRELAIQVAESFERYASAMPGLRVAPIYGGQDYQAQFRSLGRGAHVVVGTPGRTMDHIRRGSLKLDGLRCLVLDEADEMLRMGFADDVEWVLTQSPAERQIALFSATMPDAIRKIAQQHLRNPVEITIKRGASAADTVVQRYIIVPPHQKKSAVARVLESEVIDGVLIFVKMKSTTEPVADYLANQGYRTAALSSDVSQKQRERIVENLKSGKIDIIVATDVAARGLDVQRISHVINYDLPFDNESYVHRIGRTGRAGRTGNAILLLSPKEQFLLQRIERATKQAIAPMAIPSKRDINQMRVARFHEKITAVLDRPDLESFASIVEQYRTKHDTPVETIAAALAILAVGDTPLFVTEELKQTKFADSRPTNGDTQAGPGRGNPRGDRRSANPNREGRGPIRSRPSGPMETFRIEVGHAHQVKPGNIVGAIANETGLSGEAIGRIEIFDDFSTIDLLPGMPFDMFHALKRVRVGGQRLNISRVSEAAPQESAPRKKKFQAKAKRVAVTS